MRALSLFGRPSAAKQERGEERRGEERRNGIGMVCVCAPPSFVPWSVGLPGLSIFARSGPLSKLVAVVVAFVPAI
jgi:hypothetical protein